MKKFPILQVLYYTIMSIFGIVLIFYYTYQGDSSKITNEMKKAIKNEDYAYVTSLMCPFYNSTEVESIKLASGMEVHIYEAMSIYQEEVGETSVSLVSPSYFGIVVNIGDYAFNEQYQNEADATYYNESGFNAVTESGKEVFYRLGLSQDDTSEKIGEYEYTLISNRIACYSVCNYLYFEFTLNDFETTLNSEPITKIEVLNNDKSIYTTIPLENSLDFDSAFFEETKVFANEYNTEAKLLKDDTTDLSNIFTSYMETTTFSVSAREDVTKYVPLQSGLKVFAYFVIIIILGDFLVGKRFLFNLIKRHLPSKKNDSRGVSLSQDYEVNVLCKALVPEGYTDQIKIKYTKDSETEMEFILTPENKYNLAIRYPSGEYTKPIIIAKDLSPLRIPQNLTIRGFKYELTFVFEYIHKDDDSDEEEIKEEENNTIDSETLEETNLEDSKEEN